MGIEAWQKRDHAYRVTNPELIPAQRYYDEEFYKLECENLWPHVWQMACRLEQIPNVGDWVEYTNIGKSVVVVRTKDGVKAFNNHCRHRGVPIAGGKGNEHGNCAKTGFICPFHGWRWNMDGDCTFVYGRHMFNEELLKDEDLKLRPVRCETWGGCAFINFDDEAPSYREMLGEERAAAFEARNMDTLRAEWWFGAVLPANWKIAMEAFQEGYHVMKTHPQLQHAAPIIYNARYGNQTGGLGPVIADGLSARDCINQQFEHFELLSQGMAGLIHKKEVDIARQCLAADLTGEGEQAVMDWFNMVMDEITKQLSAKGEKVGDVRDIWHSQPLERIEFLFPNYFLLTFFTSMSSYRIRPLGPESCLFEIWSLTNYPEGEEPVPPTEPTILPFDSKDFPQIPQQDYSNIPIQQKGLHSEGFEYLRLSKDTEGLIANNHQVIDGFIQHVGHDKLGPAVKRLGGNFDGPILDFGF